MNFNDDKKRMIESCTSLEDKINNIQYEFYDLYSQMMRYSSESKRILNYSVFQRMEESIKGLVIATQFLRDYKYDLDREVERDEKLENVLRCDC